MLQSFAIITPEDPSQQNIADAFPLTNRFSYRLRVLSVFRLPDLYARFLYPCPADTSQPIICHPEYSTQNRLTPRRTL